MMTRREAIKAVALTAGALAVAPSFVQGAAADSSASSSTYPFKLPELGYSYDALEPYIDAQTMQIHHDKHNAAYVENLNKALAQAPESVQKLSLEELLLSLDTIPENIRTAVRNNAGGQYNHSFFWKILKKNEGGQPQNNPATTFPSINSGFLSTPEPSSNDPGQTNGPGVMTYFEWQSMQVFHTLAQSFVVC